MSKRGQKVGTGKSAVPTVNSGMSAPQTNAWAQPLRTKTTTTANSAPPGLGKVRNHNDVGTNAAGQTFGTQNALRERFLHLSLSMVGQRVVVTQTNGTILEGVFHTSSPFSSLPADVRNRYVIKACKVMKAPVDEQGSSANKVGLSTVIISADKVAAITVKSMRLDALSGGNGSTKTDAFRTDTEISGVASGRAKELVVAGSAWTTGPGSRADALLGSLEDRGARRKGFPPSSNTAPGGLRGTIGEWDQFKANEDLFNVSATFNENLYTTELDKSQLDTRKLAEAERIAREIESTVSTNIHVKEERGQAVQGDFDEEDLYSGVLKETPARLTTNDEEKTPGGQTKVKLSERSAPPVKMNYAAAAAKADVNKKSPPPGFPSSPSPVNDRDGKLATNSEVGMTSTTEVSSDAIVKEKKPTEETSNTNPKVNVDSTSENENVAGDTKAECEVSSQDQEDSTAVEISVEQDRADKAKVDVEEGSKEETVNKNTPSVKGTSKLNANAKEFTLNPSAKSFTPGAATANTAVAPVSASQESQFVDPTTGMPLPSVAPHINAPHYLHATHMGQPGMMPMMSPQFPGGMRYPSSYAGMDQQMVPLQTHQPQHLPPHSSGTHGNTDASSPPETDEESTAPGADKSQTSSTHNQQGHLQQPSQMQMPYGVPPPGSYYPGGMTMHPRGPGAPHPGYHHQFVGSPQQMPVAPGGAPYRHMYPLQPGSMPPNMQVRGPGGPYYPGGVAPVPYPTAGYVGHGMMDDDSGYRSGRAGRGPGGRAGRRGGRRTNRGGRGYSYHPHGGGGRQLSYGAGDDWSGGEGNAGIQASSQHSQPASSTAENNQAAAP